MLGRLFSTATSSLNQNAANSSAGRSKQSPESVQEEIYTRSLLFPEPSLLHQSQSQLYPLPNTSSSSVTTPQNSFDYYGDLDLESPRDIRVIVTQDSTALQPDKTVLFDSRPVTATTDKQPELQRPIRKDELRQDKRPRSSGSTPADLSTPRQRGLATPFEPPQTPAFGAFQRAARRTVTTSPEYLPNKQKNELQTYLDCIFGTAPLAYKGPSTKLHVIPIEVRPDSKHSTGISVIAEGGGSIGRAEGRRRSLLAQSYTPGNPSTQTSSNLPSHPLSRTPPKKVVLITRMFSVFLPGPQSAPREVQTPDGQNSGYPFPSVLPEEESKRPTVKQIKTPMFAVSLIINLPNTKSAPSSAKSGPSSYTTNNLVGSYNGYGSIPSSFDGEKRGGPFDSVFAPDSNSLFGSMSGEGEDSMDIITQRWDVISRILGSLQRFAETEIYTQLREAEDALSRSLQSSHTSAPNYMTRPLRTNQQTVQLPPSALMNVSGLLPKIEDVEKRAILALRIPRVVTGQGRWGVWREEARWMSRWATNKQQNAFFYTILSGFLACHHDWLEILGPRAYRRKSRQRRQASSEDDNSLPQRTIVISNDKMTARRLVFLLAAFLPASQAADEFPRRRPVTTASLRGYSQSPPGAHMLREESSRRTNTRQRSARGSSRGHGRTMSFPIHADIDEHGWSEAHGMRRGEPHSSAVQDEFGSKRSVLPLPQGEESSRKTSAATTSTATPSALSAHITRMQEEASNLSLDHRRGSSGSLASINLMQTLKRNDTRESTLNNETRTPSRWGSLMSGLWSIRRESSTEQSDAVNTSDEIVTSSNRVWRPDIKPDTLSSMVNEADELRQPQGISRDLSAESTTKPNESTPSLIEASYSSSVASIGEPAESTHSQAIPARPHKIESPLRLSVDEKDGIIDVDIGLPLFRASSPYSNSPFSSPSARGYLSLSSFDAHNARGSSPHSTPNYFHSSTCPFATAEPLPHRANVAAFLPRIHPDFALQAVPTYPELEKELQAALVAEPLPALASLDVVPGVWYTASTALVINATTSTITQMRMERRLITARSPTTPGATRDTPNLETRFTTDSNLAPDPTLSAALDRMLATSGSSTPSSRSRSASRQFPTRHPNNNSAATANQSTPPPVRDVPRAECKRALLASLEEVIAAVVRDMDDDHDPDIRLPESCLKEGIRSWLRALRSDIPSSATISAAAAPGSTSGSDPTPSAASSATTMHATSADSSSPTHAYHHHDNDTPHLPTLTSQTGARAPSGATTGLGLGSVATVQMQTSTATPSTAATATATSSPGGVRAY